MRFHASTAIALGENSRTSIACLKNIFLLLIGILDALARWLLHVKVIIVILKLCVCRTLKWWLPSRTWLRIQPTSPSTRATRRSWRSSTNWAPSSAARSPRRLNDTFMDEVDALKWHLLLFFLSLSWFIFFLCANTGDDRIEARCCLTRTLDFGAI